MADAVDAAANEAPGAEPRLRINEIFCSIQGESTKTGLPTVFVRLTGCPLRCRYCDTAYAFYEGQWMSLAEVITAVGRYKTPHVTVTGGEPLAQKDCLPFLVRLCDAGWQVSLETSGALDISSVDPRVVRVVDMKTPGSGEKEKNRKANLSLLRKTDQLKFVLCDRADYDWSVEFLRRHELPAGLEVLFSPSHGQLAARDLADWIIADQLPVRLQIQLHKLLWDEERGR